MPRKFTEPSQFIVWMLYFFVYIPSSIIPTLQGLILNQFTLSLALFAGFMAIRAGSAIKVTSLAAPKISHRAFWSVFFVIYTLLIGYVYYTFRDVISIASVDEVYSQRFAAGDVQIGTLAGYASGFLSGAFNPFLIAVGLQQRRPLLMLLGVFGQILIYATVAAKAVIASTLLIPILYFFVIRSRRNSNPTVAGAYAVVVTTIPMLLFQIPFLSGQNALSNIVMPILYMRTMMTPGALTGLYAEFFTFNPVTYFSHIGLLARFLHYPYDLPLGMVIGYSVTGEPMNANANFFATDGIAALGIWGMPLIGLVLGLILKIVDRVLDPRVYAAFCAASIPAVFSLANSSLFLTLLTGGMVMLIVLFVFWGGVTEDEAPRSAFSGLGFRGSANPRSD